MHYPLQVSGLFKSFVGVKHDDSARGNSGAVVRDLSFSINSGELFALLGPSGCGKSTILRLIAGFEQPDRGEIRSFGKVLAENGVRLIPPEKRGIGIVFQDYALFPHLTVRKNVAFGLIGYAASAKKDRLDETLELLALNGLSGRYPHELSGGEQQRVAIARSLAPRPSIILLDEPFSNLDARLRSSTRTKIRSLLKRSGVTTVLVTHDQEEAMSFADRIAVMRNGHIEQIGTPEDLYFKPNTRFVAEFLGQTNVLKSKADGRSAKTAFGDIGLNDEADGDVWISVRPEHLSLNRPDSSRDLPIGIVTNREFKGHDITYTVSINDVPVLVHTSNLTNISVGDRVVIRPLENGIVVSHD